MEQMNVLAIVIGDVLMFGWIYGGLHTFSAVRLNLLAVAG